MTDKTRLLAELERRTKRRRLWKEYAQPFDHTKPFSEDNQGVYDWQVEFHNSGADNPERLLIAANRVGKTRTGAAETAIHLTGEYPPWWKGKRFNEPVQWWCGSVTNEASKDIVQEALLGPINALGTGWIPGDRIVGKPTFRQAGISEVVDTIHVKHTSGGISQCTLKTYEQGRAKWQGKSLHGVWPDEEIPMDIYTEALTRVLDKKGIMLCTFTPLLGPTEVVLHFLNASAGAGIFSKNVSWEDAPHLDRGERERLMNSYPEHERDTRTKGTPLMGSGAIFPIADEQLLVDPPEIKPWWRLINGIDFGIDHPAAGVFCALDPEGPGTFYVYDCYKKPGETAVYHAAAMKKHGEWIPNAWPKDGIQREKGAGLTIKDHYRSHGLRMLKEHAAYKDERGDHVEPGVIEMLEWMRTGRFKVSRLLHQWFEEKRMYHRDDGQIVKKRDDLMAATRYAFVMRRFARVKPTDTPIGRFAPSVPIVGRRRWHRNEA